MLDVTGSANVGALTATSLNVSGPTNTVNLGLTHSLANRTTDTVFYSSDGNYIYKNTAAGLRTALDVPSASEAVFTGNVGIGITTPGYTLDVSGTLHAGNSYFDNIYIGGSTDKGLRSVSGDYGTVQTTGSGAGAWEGYSIDGRYVFMSSDDDKCGIYNDLDNEWMVYCYRNSYTRLYYNGSSKVETTNSGVKIEGHIFANSGINVYKNSASSPSYSNATWSDHIYMSNYKRRWSMGVEASGSYAMGFYRWGSANGGGRYLNGYIHGNYYNRHMNNFTGQHRTFIENISHKSAINYEGLIVSANKNRYIKMSDGVEHGNKAITINESLPVVSLSNVSMDKSCFGVISSSEDPDNRTESFGKFVSVFDKELGDTRIYINSVGEGAIWVTNINGNLESGDYITTSNIAGYGMKQESDSLKNYTVAKITMDCDFNPQQQPVKRILKQLSNVNYWVKTTKIDIYEDEYNLLDETDREISYDEESNPIYKRIEIHEVDKDPNDDTYIMETREEMVNVLDANDEFQWEDTGELEYAYNIKYITSNGTETDEANANYIAAFVGCTYHCG
jgi:hypothetical protein